MNIYRLAVLFDENAVNIPKTGATKNQLSDILAIVFAIFGAVSVLVITIAGLQYILSRGEPDKTAKAKNTIIYALIGLAISILAFSIVTFVVRRV